MQKDAKPPRRWPWYIAIGVLGILVVFAIQSFVVGVTAAAGVCGDLEIVSQSAAMSCKLDALSDPAKWLNRWLAGIAVVVAVGVGLALWNADFHSRIGLNNGPRDKRSVDAEYRPIVSALIMLFFVALFINLPNLLSGTPR